MDSLELQQREVEEDFKECVLSGLQEVKHHLAELTEEVKLVKRSSTGSEMEQIKSTVAESNFIIKLLAADMNTTRTMMLSEFRNVLHAIPRKDALQEQLIAVNEEVQKIRQVQTETQSQLGTLQLKLCDVKGALQQEEMDLSDSNNRQKELQKDLQATGDEILKAQKQVCVLKGELIRVISESSRQLKALQTQLSDIDSVPQEAKKHLLERKDIQNEFQGVLQTKKFFEAEEDVGRLKMVDAKLQSFPARSEKVQFKSKESTVTEEPAPSAPVVAPLIQKERVNESEPLQEQKVEEVNKTGINDVNTVVEKNLRESAVTPKSVDTVETKKKVDSNGPEKEKADFRKKADMNKKAAAVDNANSVLAEVSMAWEGKGVQDKKLKDEDKKKLEDEKSKNKEADRKPEYKIIGLKYTYRADQWSPLNQEGKKQYDRDFLLQFRQDCISKPQGLPDIPDIVLEKADVRPFLDTKSITSTKVPDNLFLPNYMKSPRMNNWKPIRKEAKPVMIDHIRKEADQEKQNNEQEQIAARLAARINKRSQKSTEKYQQEDGWNTFLGGRSAKQNIIEHPSKLEITRQNYEENVQLGSRGRLGSFERWGKGTSAGGGQKSSNYFEHNLPQTHRFRMLQEEKSLRSMLHSRDSNKSRSSSSSKRSRERDKDRLILSQVFPRVNYCLGPDPVAPSISEKEYEKRSKATIEEYLSVKDFKEVTACIKELQSPELQHILVRVAIEDVLEKKAHMRESIGRLFRRLLDDSTISLEQFKIGLKEILEFADDMAIDIPLYWTYLGEIIGGMAAEGAQNFTFLKESVLMVQGKSAKFMAEIMKAGVKYTNEQQMYNVWRASSFTWDMFLPQGSNVKEFLMDNNLTFTDQPVEKAAQIPPKEENRIGNFQRDLMLFQKDNLNNNAAINFIEETIPPELRKTKKFIRALVSAVCYGAVKGEGTNIRGDYELLKSRSVIMQRYINGNPELELQALYAVQHLNNSLENPPALLRLYFDVLYDEDIISEDTFYAWRDSQDPNEKIGKRIAFKSVTSFYTWLEESDPPS